MSPSINSTRWLIRKILPPVRTIGSAHCCEGRELHVPERRVLELPERRRRSGRRPVGVREGVGPSRRVSPPPPSRRLGKPRAIAAKTARCSPRARAMPGERDEDRLLSRRPVRAGSWRFRPRTCSGLRSASLRAMVARLPVATMWTRPARRARSIRRGPRVVSASDVVSRVMKLAPWPRWSNEMTRYVIGEPDPPHPIGGGLPSSRARGRSAPRPPGRLIVEPKGAAAQLRHRMCAPVGSVCRSAVKHSVGPRPGGS